MSNHFYEFWQAAKAQGLIPEGNEFTVSVSSDATSFDNESYYRAGARTGDGRMKPTNEEISEVFNYCVLMDNEGRTAYRGMTFEQGVLAAIRWLRDGEENPVLESTTFQNYRNSDSESID